MLADGLSEPSTRPQPPAARSPVLIRSHRRRTAGVPASSFLGVSAAPRAPASPTGARAGSDPPSSSPQDLQSLRLKLSTSPRRELVSSCRRLRSASSPAPPTRGSDASLPGPPQPPPPPPPAAALSMVPIRLLIRGAWAPRRPPTYAPGRPPTCTIWYGPLHTSQDLPRPLIWCHRQLAVPSRSLIRPSTDEAHRPVSGGGKDASATVRRRRRWRRRRRRER